MWPGFGDNSRVLKWVLERVTGDGEARDTAIGLLPTVAAIDRSGTDLDDLTMLIGPDTAARLIEIGVSEAEGIEFIVHAMPARDQFLET